MLYFILIQFRVILSYSDFFWQRVIMCVVWLPKVGDLQGIILLIISDFILFGLWMFFVSCESFLNLLRWFLVQGMVHLGKTFSVNLRSVYFDAVDWCTLNVRATDYVVDVFYIFVDFLFTSVKFWDVKRRKVRT